MYLDNMNKVQLDELLEIKINALSEVDELHSQLDSINQKILTLQTSEELNSDISLILESNLFENYDDWLLQILTIYCIL